jgi:hypothetical protein
MRWLSERRPGLRIERPMKLWGRWASARVGFQLGLFLGAVLLAGWFR